MTRASKPSTVSRLSRSYPQTDSMSSAQTSLRVESSLHSMHVVIKTGDERA